MSADLYLRVADTRTEQNAVHLSAQHHQQPIAYYATACISSYLCVSLCLQAAASMQQELKGTPSINPLNGSQSETSSQQPPAPFGSRFKVRPLTPAAAAAAAAAEDQKYGSAEAFAAGATEAGAGDGQQQLLLPRQLDFGSNSSTAVSVPSMRVWLWRRHGFGRSLCKVYTCLVSSRSSLKQVVHCWITVPSSCTPNMLLRLMRHIIWYHVAHDQVEHIWLKPTAIVLQRTTCLARVAEWR
jgi:hypothetical protein